MDPPLLDERFSSCPRASLRHSHRSIATGFPTSLSWRLQSTICYGMFAVAFFHFPIQQSMCFEYNFISRPSSKRKFRVLCRAAHFSLALFFYLFYTIFMRRHTKVLRDFGSYFLWKTEEKKLLKLLVALVPSNSCFILFLFFSEKHQEKKEKRTNNEKKKVRKHLFSMFSLNSFPLIKF